ncbi:MAG: amidohydrolase family protein [Planctomycetaceae bacterium]
MRIDSHHHFWRYSPPEYPWIDDAKSELRRDFLPEHLRTAMQPCGIDGVVSVQARQTLEETKALLEFASEHPWIRGVVGWVPLRDVAVGDVLAEVARHPRLRGVRHVVQDEPDDRFLIREEFVRGIAMLEAYGLVYDLLIFPHQLPAAIELVDRFPKQTFVLDHIAKPAIELAGLDEAWRQDFERLAERDNVYCKFSGVITEVRDAQWTVETIRPYWNIALEAFGPARLMFGSDWPVCLLRGQYDEWVSAVAELAGSLSSAEKSSFWGQTAVTAYSLH